jgi:hypothetical protein
MGIAFTETSEQIEREPRLLPQPGFLIHKPPVSLVIRADHQKRPDVNAASSWPALKLVLLEHVRD